MTEGPAFVVRSNVGQVVRDLNALPADVKRAARRRLREVGRPIGRVVVAEGAETLPARGGLRGTVASRATVTVSHTATGVRLKLGRKGAYVAGPDAGKVRHPVYGNRKKWATTAVEAGKFTAAFEAHGDEVRDAVDEVVGDVLERFQSSNPGGLL